MATIGSIFRPVSQYHVTGDDAGDLVVQDYIFDIKASQIVLNDIVEIGVLPMWHTVDDCILLCDPLDIGGTPTLSVDVGLMSGTPDDLVSVRTCGNEFFALDTSVRAGLVSRMTKKAGMLITPSEFRRSIGIKFTAAAATPAAGRMRLRVFMHPNSISSFQ